MIKTMARVNTETKKSEKIKALGVVSNHTLNALARLLLGAIILYEVV